MQTDKGLVLAAQALETLPQQQIILPALSVVDAGMRGNCDACQSAHLSDINRTADGSGHINLSGDYVWRQNRKVEDGQFRPLRCIGKS